MQNPSFYQNHLETVSRSFSFCIAQLPPREKEWVSIAYLLCRIVDTIEDSSWPNQDAQFLAFRELKAFLTVAPSEEQFSSWLHAFPDTVIPEEQRLLADLPILIADKDKLPEAVQHALIKTIHHMIGGMMYFLNHYKKNNNTVLLPSLDVTNQYCFFAAGIVGELLSHFFTYSIPKFQYNATLLMQSFHFGLFLQKINILKDAESDALAGRYFLLSRAPLRASLLVNARYALEYLKAIPITGGRPYRLFCAWSLFIGLASLKWMDKRDDRRLLSSELLITEQGVPASVASCYKIGSRETYYIMDKIRRLIDDNEALEALFNRYVAAENDITPDGKRYPTARLPDWFTAIYQDDLSQVNLTELGMFCPKEGALSNA